MDIKKKLSLKLKKGKEELARKALSEFINKSSGNGGGLPSGGAGDKFNTTRLTRQEERHRLDALHKYQKRNIASSGQESVLSEEESPRPHADPLVVPEKKTRILSTKILAPNTGKDRIFLSPRANSSETTKILRDSDVPSRSSGKLQKLSQREEDEKPKKSSLKRRREGSSEFVESRSSSTGGHDFFERKSYKYSQSRKRFSRRGASGNAVGPNPKRGQLIVIETRLITTRELSVLLSEPMSRIMGILKRMGEACGEDEGLKKETVELLALELGHEIKYKLSTAEVLATARKNDTTGKESLRSRIPVVTVMGHIDHGKTTLLDALRRTNVTASESGGITQHIGAYQVKVGEKSITFIDTPGHAAFTSMRMRGARVTDIVVLIVAADDGVNEQTVEAIKHAKAAEVPIVVAINKIDKSSANPSKVIAELAQHGIIVEEMQGDVMSVNISAKNCINLDKLEELILLQADFLELEYNPKRPAEGVVIESRLDKRCGAFSTFIIKEGELKTGQVVVLGSSYGKIRSMVDSSGKVVKTAVAGTPVEVLGLSEAPEPGTQFFVAKNEKEARAIVESCKGEKENSEERATRDSFENEKHKLNFIVKSDVNGSAEAIVQSIRGILHPEVDIAVIHSGVGDINDSDVLLAEVSDAYIIGFRVKAEKTMKDSPKIIFQSIIYDVIKKIQEIVEALVSPKTKEVVLGSAVVKEIFVLSDKSSVAGCQVKSGVMKKSVSIRIIRDGEPMRDFSIKSLKRFREEVKEVKAGYECGILLNGYNDFKVGDILESFELLSTDA